MIRLVRATQVVTVRNLEPGMWCEVSKQLARKVMDSYGLSEEYLPEPGRERLLTTGIWLVNEGGILEVRCYGRVCGGDTPTKG